MNMIHTGIESLDRALGGGIPAYSMNLIAGQPGTGKTILAQQMLFNSVHADREQRVLYLTTLSEPSLKVLRYLQGFAFFQPEWFGKQVVYQDMGALIREARMEELAPRIDELLQQHRPAIAVIDSFKAISDLAPEPKAFRQFCYDLAVRLAGAQCTAFLIGEYDRSEAAQGAEFAVADGIFYLDRTQEAGEEKRRFQILKMRGAKVRATSLTFTISEQGLRFFSPELLLGSRLAVSGEQTGWLSSGIKGLDQVLRGGFPQGRSIIVSGVSGTGKTTLCLQSLIHGARQGEKGLYITFEEPSDQLRHLARSFGFDDIGRLEEQGLVRFLYIAQTEIRLDEHIEAIFEEVHDFGPQRIVVDSFSVFLYKETDSARQRDKAAQMVSLVRGAGAFGMFISDVPADQRERFSRFGVEETVLDGTILLSMDLMGERRKRYLEICKMRGVNYTSGRHRMRISQDGVEVFQVGAEAYSAIGAPAPLSFSLLDGLALENFSYGASWLVRGDSGAGKSLLTFHFVMEALQRGDTVLYLAVDAPPFEVKRAMHLRSFDPDAYLASGQLLLADVFSQGRRELDLEDQEAFLFGLFRKIEGLPKPAVVVLDSLASTVPGSLSGGIVDLAQQKNRMLARPDVTVMDTLLNGMLDDRTQTGLMNGYDIVLDLFTPDWGDMRLSGSLGHRVLQIKKARGLPVDSRPFPYTIDPGRGIVINTSFYPPSPSHAPRAAGDFKDDHEPN
jgi:circadian clock protein KaiC